jgi:hypothetical protein
LKLGFLGIKNYVASYVILIIFSEMLGMRDFRVVCSSTLTNSLPAVALNAFVIVDCLSRQYSSFN